MHDMNEIYRILLSRNFQLELFDELISKKCVSTDGSNINTMCPMPDHKDTNPSFSISTTKNVYNCFGCGAKGDWAEYLQQTNNWTFRQAADYLAAEAGVAEVKEAPKRKIITTTLPNVKQPEVDYDKNLSYWIECWESLLAHDRALDLLEKTRGINRKTVETLGIGIHKEKDFGYYKTDVWVFPCRDITHVEKDRIIGFEYRKRDWKPFGSGNKCVKQKGTVSQLVQINSRKEGMNNCIVLEGFPDAYCYYQYAYDKGNADKLHVLTPSCGVNTLLKNVEKFDFGSYDKVTFLLDTDSAGIDMSKKLNELYPEFNYNVSLPKPFTDFGEWYLENRSI